MFNQGKKFNQDQKKYKSLVEKYNLNLISVNQLNIVNNLKTKTYANLNEGFTGVDMDPVEQKNLEEKNKITTLEGEFNNNMGRYITLYKTYLDELASKQGSLNTTLKNKVVQYNGQYFYINNTGTIRQFTDSSWKGKDNSCSDSSKTLSPTEFSKLSRREGGMGNVIAVSQRRLSFDAGSVPRGYYFSRPCQSRTYPPTLPFHCAGAPASPRRGDER